MHGWNRDGNGHVKMSPVIGWKTATPLSETANVFLRIEFGVGHDLDNVSALQFSFTVLQARMLSRQLAEAADKQDPPRSAPPQPPG